MSCSYRINENVFIGASVRKTGGAGTIKYKNLPVKGVRITDFEPGGFTLTHKNFGKQVWLDYTQMPLTKLTIIKGVIQEELVLLSQS